jgi:hypothetical protein
VFVAVVLVVFFGVWPQQSDLLLMVYSPARAFTSFQRVNFFSVESNRKTLVNFYSRAKKSSLKTGCGYKETSSLHIFQFSNFNFIVGNPFWEFHFHCSPVHIKRPNYLKRKCHNAKQCRFVPSPLYVYLMSKLWLAKTLKLQLQSITILVS